MYSSRLLLTTWIGLLSSIGRAFLLDSSLPTLHDATLIGWLTWAILYVACKLRAYRSGGFSLLTRPFPASVRSWLDHIKIAVLSCAVVSTHFLRYRVAIQLGSPMVIIFVLIITTVLPPREVTPDNLENGLAVLPRNEGLLGPDKAIIPLRISLRILTNAVLYVFLTALYGQRESSMGSEFASSFVFAALLAFILSLLHTIDYSSISSHRSVDSSLDWDLLERLSIFSLFILTRFALPSVSTMESMESLLLMGPRVVMEAAWWMSILLLTSEDHMITSTTFDTVAISFTLTNANNGIYWQIITSSVSCIGALWQTVTSFRIDAPKKYLYILILIPIFNFALTQNDLVTWPLSEKFVAHLHPVEIQAASARTVFANLLQKQSTTLEQAEREYRLRYDHSPPPNFDKWFELAMLHGFVLIDEFDTLMRALQPFRGVPPSVLQSQTSYALENHADFLVRYTLNEGSTSVSNGDRSPWFREAMERLLPHDWIGLLPNMNLAINVFDEPCVSVPRDGLDLAMRCSRANGCLDLEPKKDHLLQPPRFLDIGKQDAWEAMTVSCPANSAARSSSCLGQSSNGPLPFIGNLTESKDICDHCELQSLEGFLISPETLQLTHSLTPIWSQAKPTLFNDILLPSPYYIEKIDDYVEAEDPDWDSKRDQLYWVGAATGGHMTEANWQNMQRQRMTMMTQHDSQIQTRLLNETKPGRWRAYNASISDVASLFSTRIMGVTPQCEQPACVAQKETFGIGDEEVKDALSTAYAYKIHLDIDGNGFSGRFYRLLRSKSMVVKQTLFEEWHDDRLMPWVHYAPVTTSFEELPELVRFLATEKRGKEIAKRMADESREWAGKSLREVDMQLVWLRLLLEYGRLIDPERDG